MSRSLRSERGGVVVLAAVMIPVFLLLTALVFDVGDWYTHKRQLQNRADAAAFSAGVEYQKNWKACVQNGDPALKLATAQKIANAARQYAGDPQASDYAPATMPTPVNTELANQSKVDVVINSTSHTNDTDNSDGGGALNTVAGSPCYAHAADDISAAGYWTDVKVKEKDLPSLVGTIGLPLSQNLARARIEIRPATSGHRFLPLAVPDFEITRVQVRYFDECRDPNHNSPLATKDLAPLPVPEQHDYIASGGGTLWTLPVPGSNPLVGDKSLSFGLTIPVYQGGSGACGSAQYLPVGVEVRIASRDEVDFNQSCATLRNNVKFADCFSRLSQIRVYNDGNPDNQVRITNVRLSGGCPTPGDAYFATLPFGLTTCPYDVSAEVNWGNRTQGALNVPANFHVTVNGVDMTPPSGNPTGVWTTSGGALQASEGANTVTVAVSWEDQNPAHAYPDGSSNKCSNKNGNPCKYSDSQATHQAFVATTDNAGAVELVRTSQSPLGVDGLPGPPLDNIATGGTTGTPASPVQIFPTVGTRSTLKAGGLTTLRLDDSQGNQTLRCDPAISNGQEFKNFVTGCKPWYAKNQWSSPWWDTTTRTCPNAGLWFSTTASPAPYGLNSSTNPWQCVQLSPGKSTGQVGDWFSAATGNCDNIGNNKCQAIDCNVDGNYDGKTGSPTGWLQAGGDSRNPRVVGLFIVPYQALKGAAGGSGSQVVPILGFASFYVMNWTGPSSDSDPCPDKTLGTVNIPQPPKSSANGVFVEAVDFEAGPVDPTATCYEGLLTQCRAVLVR